MIRRRDSYIRWCNTRPLQQRQSSRSRVRHETSKAIFQARTEPIVTLRNQGAVVGQNVPTRVRSDRAFRDPILRPSGGCLPRCWGGRFSIAPCGLRSVGSRSSIEENHLHCRRWSLEDHRPGRPHPAHCTGRQPKGLGMGNGRFRCTGQCDGRVGCLSRPCSTEVRLPPLRPCVTLRLGGGSHPKAAPADGKATEPWAIWDRWRFC
jgi:hypothetical protein